MQPNDDRARASQSGPIRPQSRDDRIPRDVLYRVMPRVDVPEVPRDPTLLEELTGSFYVEQARTSKDVSSRIKDDGKRR